MKILCISDAWLPQINGVVRTYQNVGKVLEEMGHQFRVIGPSDFKVTIPAPTYSEIRLAIFARWTLPQMIRDQNPDTIHIATEGPLGRAARRYCLRNNIQFTSCYHSQFPDYLADRVKSFAPFLAGPVKKFTARSLRKFHSAARKTMVATPSLENFLRSQGHRQPLHRFVRGIDTQIYHPGKKSLFEKLQRPVALYVGRVSVEKNLNAFLDAPWAGSKVIVGDGPALQDLKKRYPDAIFTGIQTGESLAAHYRSADIFAFPSKTDTFGIVLIEALASGLAVAAYPVSGPEDIINRPELGVLDNDFGAALEKALLTPGSPENRFSVVTERYTWEKAAGQFLSGLTPLQK